MTKTEFDNKLTSFNKKITSNKTKHLGTEKRLENLITKDYNFFLGGICFTSNDGSQNMFVYQPSFNLLKLKIDKSTVYIIGWKLERLHNSKFIALHSSFLPNVKYFRNKIGMQFDNTPLVIEQINYINKIVNLYIVYDLNNWPKTPLGDVTLKNCLL